MSKPIGVIFFIITISILSFTACDKKPVNCPIVIKPVVTTEKHNADTISKGQLSNTKRAIGGFKAMSFNQAAF